MGRELNDNQKLLVMLQGDLLDGSLSEGERASLAIALEKAGGDVPAALALLDPPLARKAEDLTGQGLALSLELERLEQRGVSILFRGERPYPSLDRHFETAPLLLFVAGDEGLIEKGAPVFFALDSFADSGCSGVLVADRGFDKILRDDRVAESLRQRRAAVVSDKYRSRASAAKGHRADRARPAETPRRDPSSKTVFISGSRSQVFVPKAMQDSLEAIIRQKITVLIGDSDKGVDREIVDFFRAPLYEKVVIYTVSTAPRLAVESEWRVEVVASDSSLKGRERQTVKDRAMADAADWGLALFNPIEKNRYGAIQVSSGTLRNAVQMLLREKPVKFFYVYEGEVRAKDLKSLDDLEGVLESYRSERLDGEGEKVILSAKGVSPGSDASEAKTAKILGKYRLLLKSEKVLLSEEDGAPCLKEAAGEEVQPSLF